MNGPLIHTLLRDSLSEEVGRLFFHFLDFFYSIKTFNFLDQLELMFDTKSFTLYVNFEDLIQFSDELADVIEEQFVRVEPFICESIMEFTKKYYWKIIAEFKNQNYRYFVGFYNFPYLKPITSLNCSVIGKLISISGIIIRVTESNSELAQGAFECGNISCKFKITKVDQRFGYYEPKFCPFCGNTDSWILKLENSVFTEIQKIKIQEFPQKIKTGAIPQTLDVILKEDHIGVTEPGSAFLLTGFLVPVPLDRFIFPLHSEDFRGNQKTNTVSVFKENFLPKPLFSLKFIASHVFCLDSGSDTKLQNSTNRKMVKNKIEFSRQERETILKIRGQPNLYRFMVSHFIPTFFEENIKAGLLLMLLGGTKKFKKKEKCPPENINICMIGGPFLEKIQFFKNLPYFFPKITSFNGQISSGSGITSSISEELETNKFYLDAGALALSQNGVCFIEEFDKLKKEDQFSIIKVIENQNISIGKGIPVINTKTNVSILASVDSNTRKHVELFELKKNIFVQSSVLNKFDLVFFLKSSGISFENLKFSRKKFNLNQKFRDGVPMIPTFLLSHLYFSFARLLNPVITKESCFLLIEIYKYLRNSKRIDISEKFFITIRQLESLVKLSEAFSKLFLCLKVNQIHIKAASRLLFSSFPDSNFSAKIFFSNFRDGFFCPKKKEKLNKYKSQNFSTKKTFLIGFSRFQRISNCIIKLIEVHQKKGFIGISFENLLKILVKKKHNSMPRKKWKQEIFRLIFTIKNLIFDQKTLVMVRSCLINGQNYTPKVLICLE